ALARAMRREARTAPADQTEQLARAAEIVEEEDPAKLAALLRSLQERGFDLRRLPAGALPPQMAGGAAAPAENTSVSGRQAAEPTRLASDPGPVYVYHPDYEPVSSPDADERADTSLAATWSRADIRADQAARTGRLPAEYHEVVRNFFDATE
ncbi:MAG: hypothetical protein ACOC93_05710, partial [Planctomycetota bacterium]